MAEMTTLVAAIYRKYTTIPTDGFDSASPSITARYEVFYDESYPEVRVCHSPLRLMSTHPLMQYHQDHECRIAFLPQSSS